MAILCLLRSRSHWIQWSTLPGMWCYNCTLQHIVPQNSALTYLKYVWAEHFLQIIFSLEHMSYRGVNIFPKQPCHLPHFAATTAFFVILPMTLLTIVIPHPQEFPCSKGSQLCALQIMLSSSSHQHSKLSMRIWVGSLMISEGPHVPYLSVHAVKMKRHVGISWQLNRCPRIPHNALVFCGLSVTIESRSPSPPDLSMWKPSECFLNQGNKPMCS